MKPKIDLVTLPPEIKLTILRLLSHRDLCSMARVCRVWRHATEDPQLWRHCKLLVRTRDIHAIKSFANIPRYAQSSTLRFEGNIPAKEAESILR